MEWTRSFLLRYEKLLPNCNELLNALQYTFEYHTFTFNLNLFLFRPDVKNKNVVIDESANIYTFSLNIHALFAFSRNSWKRKIHNSNAHIRDFQIFFFYTVRKSINKIFATTNFIVFGISCFWCLFIVFFPSLYSHWLSYIRIQHLLNFLFKV
jgi:hypothetical protein